VGLRRIEVGQRSETVRRANLSSIVRELHLRGPQTRSELVARTGLTRSAIRGLVGELARAGLATENPTERPGTPGRPSPQVSLVPQAATVLALDIAVDSMASAVVGLSGEVFDRVRVDRPRGHSSVDDVVADLAGMATLVLSDRPSHERLIGVGVAMVGTVRRTDGMVAMAPNLGWTEVPLGRHLERAIGLDVPLAVGNEADLGALAESRRGVATGVSDVVYLSGEVGVGGGLIVDGRPLSGSAGFGGEIGHIPVDPDGASCRCGSIGCWETVVGEDTLLRWAGQPESGGREAVERVLAEADAGHPVAQAALDDVGRWLGIGLAGLINVLNPTLIVLGGRLGRIHRHVARAMEAELDRRTLPASRALVRVAPSALGDDAPLFGAAELAFEPLLADPALWLRPGLATVDLATA
jgi:predicted NBD/HSP70 family sugar kinase